MSEKSFKIFMFLWAVSFLVVGCIFIFAPHSITHILSIPSEQREYLWLALAGSMMITISYLSYSAGIKEGFFAPLKALILCKFTSSILFVFFAWQLNNFMFLLGTLVDFPIFLIFLWTYKKQT